MDSFGISKTEFGGATESWTAWFWLKTLNQYQQSTCLIKFILFMDQETSTRQWLVILSCESENRTQPILRAIIRQLGVAQRGPPKQKKLTNDWIDGKTQGKTWKDNKNRTSSANPGENTVINQLYIGSPNQKNPLCFPKKVQIYEREMGFIK